MLLIEVLILLISLFASFLMGLSLSPSFVNRKLTLVGHAGVLKNRGVTCDLSSFFFGFYCSAVFLLKNDFPLTLLLLGSSESSFKLTLARSDLFSLSVFCGLVLNLAKAGLLPVRVFEGLLSLSVLEHHGGLVQTGVLLIVAEGKRGLVEVILDRVDFPVLLGLAS